MIKRSDDWYRKRLQKYFDEHYGIYEYVAEFFVNPAPNQWKFNIPGRGLTITLTCNYLGDVTEESGVILKG